ncbi:MAG: TRAP transporter small permease subunit [Desulfofustis sp.]|nr:TRAP transporter small permease subunit [Desulfofustis sp.]
MSSSALRKIIETIDRMSDLVGHFAKYLILVLIYVLIYEVAARYVFNKPTIWALETSQMVFGAIGALCWGYTLKIGGHVRVDVFYTMFSNRWKAIVDVVMTFIFLFPIQYILIHSGIKWTLFALKTNEKMVDSSWLPPSWPFRLVLTIGFILFFIQTLSELTKNVYFIINGNNLIETKPKYVKEGLV